MDIVFSISSENQSSPLLVLRREPEMLNSRRALRLWERKLDAENFTEPDMLDKILTIKSAYKNSLNQQKIKYKTGAIKSIVKFSTALVEDAFKLKNLTETAFSLSGESLRLTERI